MKMLIDFDNNYIEIEYGNPLTRMKFSEKSKLMLLKNIIEIRGIKGK